MRVAITLLITALCCLGATTPAVSSEPAGPKAFSRIISLYSAHTENLASLGLDSEVIGISTTDDYPPEFLTKKRFSSREDPEKFIAVRPDLVLIRPMIERSYPQLIGKLQQAGITVISLQPTSVEGIFDYWRQLGALTGRSREAAKMIDRFTHELAEINQTLSAITPEEHPRVYFESIHKKMKTFAQESIAMYVLEQAGGINIASDADRVRNTNIAYYGKERILSKGNAIDIFLAQQGRMNPVTIEMIMAEPGFGAIRAVQTKKVYLVDERLVSRPTLRILDGIKEVGCVLYPSLFLKKKTPSNTNER